MPTLHLIDRLSSNDIERLQAVLEAAPGYSLTVEGKLPAPGAAIEVLDALPPGKTHADKFVYEITLDADAIGCIELVRGYPEADIAFIGLLLFRENSQGRGFGPQALRLAEAIGIGWQCRALQIAVIDTNPRAFDFWKREGFIELFRKPAMDFVGQAIVMERLLPAPISAEETHYQQRGPHLIESTKILLRRPTPQDVNCLFHIYGDPRTNMFNPAGPMRSLADAETTMGRWLGHWAENGFGTWAISLMDESDRIVGFGGLTYASFDAETRVNLGYRFATEVWGRGLATEFANIAVDYGLRTLSLKEIFAKVRYNHDASRRVLEKAGLSECGVLDDVPGAPPSIVYRVAQ